MSEYNAKNYPDDIALVDTSMGKVRGIWHYNVPKDKVTLTYYRPGRD